MMARRASTKPRQPEKLNNPFSNMNLDEILSMDQPYIDINIPAMDRRTTAFRAALGKYTTQNQQEISKRRHQYVHDVEGLRAERSRLEQDIQRHRLEEIALAKQLEEERQERKKAEDMVVHSNRQLKSLKDRFGSTEEEAKKSEQALKILKKSKEKEKSQLEKQAFQVARDVLELERLLGISVRGAGNDVLTIVFTQLDARTPEREFSVVIDLSMQEYTGTSSAFPPSVCRRIYGRNKVQPLRNATKLAKQRVYRIDKACWLERPHLFDLSGIAAAFNIVY
ncbi:kinetochore-associated Ndc80 complex subunit spc25 [Serendipita sp. 400]|nr:kinetochore-associated Ndc80 complex subunit spc25 [Serendipita sp. 400]